MEKKEGDEKLKKKYASLLIVIAILGIVSYVYTKSSSKDQFNLPATQVSAYEELKKCDRVGMTIVENSIARTGLTLEYSNIGERRVSVETKFLIEQKKDGKWYTIPFRQKPLGPMTICSIESKETKREVLRWKSVIGKLEDGHYRIIRTINESEQSQKTKGFLVKEFDVKSTTDELEEREGSTFTVELSGLNFLSQIKQVAINIKSDSITPTGMTIEIDNKGMNTCTYDTDYELEVFLNGRWYQVPPADNGYYGYTIPRSTYKVEGGKKAEEQVDWTEKYGALNYGRYRIVKSIELNDENGEQEYNIVHQFTIMGRR